MGILVHSVATCAYQLPSSSHSASLRQLPASPGTGHRPCLLLILRTKKYSVLSPSLPHALALTMQPTATYVCSQFVPFTSPLDMRSEEHTSELQSLMCISYAVFCLKKQTTQIYLKQTQT